MTTTLTGPATHPAPAAPAAQAEDTEPVKLWFCPNDDLAPGIAATLAAHWLDEHEQEVAVGDALALLGDDLHDRALHGRGHGVAARGRTGLLALAAPAALADRLLAATLHRHHLLTHPERTIRAADELQKRVLLGLIFGLTGHRAEATADGVRAHLNADQLARVRALLAGQGERLKAEALRRAEELAAEVGRGG